MTTYPAIPLALEQKRQTPVHIVLGGGLSAQVGFLQDVLGGAEVRIEEAAKLGDVEALEHIAAGKPLILLLPNIGAMTLAEDTLRKVHVWAAGPIAKRTAAIRALVRRAMVILGLTEIPDLRLDQIGDLVVTQCGEEAPPQAMIWAATWILTDLAEVTTNEKFWKHPWDDAWKWLPQGIGLPYRLNTLYRDLGAWVFARDDNKAGAELLGCSPSKFKYLKGVHMDPRKVDAALMVLSIWRTRPDTGYIAALKIGTIFEQ